MSTLTFRSLLSIVGLLSLFAGPAHGLKLGDPAPPLEISDWVKGKPVDLAKDKGKIFVVEFWATWCPPCRESIPHLTKLQADFKDKGVVVIGISDEPTRVIEPFVKKMGDKMNYTVAADKKQATTQAYLGGFGVNGIPHAFIVDKKGRLIWQGSPFEGLDQAVAMIVADKYDLEAAINADKAREKLPSYFETLMSINDEEDEKAKTELVKKAGEIGKEIVKLADKDPNLLNGIAWNIMVIPSLPHRDMELVVRAAERAHALTEGKDPSILDTYARAMWETGQYQKAIDLQKKAVELAEPEQLKKMLGEVLNQYEKELPDKLAASQPASQTQPQ